MCFEILWMSENVCFLPTCLTSTLAGRSALVSFSFLLKWGSFRHLWPWMLPWRPESSLVNGHLLSMPGLLRTCYFLIELKLLNQDILCWEFWINFFPLSLEQYILWIQSSLHFRQCYVLSNTFFIHYFSIPFLNFFVSGMLITCGFFFY